jgi:hypothetical protein
MKVTKATSAMPFAPQAGDDDLRLNLSGLTREPVMSMGMRARMAMMQMQMQIRKKKHHKIMINQRRMWRTDLGTFDVDGYECRDGGYAEKDEEEEEVSQANDGSTQNVKDSGHSTRECEDWTVYFRHVKYVNGKPNATASNVSEGQTLTICDKLSKLNRNESAACGHRPKQGINIARRCINGYSVTAAPEKSVTHVSF